MALQAWALLCATLGVLAAGARGVALDVFAHPKEDR